MGHRQSGWNLTQQHGSGAAADGHHTVMFTAEGSVYRKRCGSRCRHYSSLAMAFLALSAGLSGQKIRRSNPQYRWSPCPAVFQVGMACAACKPLMAPRGPRNTASSCRLGDASRLPRRLSEIETDGQAARRLLQGGASASLNPDLACQGCPTTDTRVQARSRACRVLGVRVWHVFECRPGVPGVGRHQHPCEVRPGGAGAGAGVFTWQVQVLGS